MPEFGFLYDSLKIFIDGVEIHLKEGKYVEWCTYDYPFGWCIYVDDIEIEIYVIKTVSFTLRFSRDSRIDLIFDRNDNHIYETLNFHHDADGWHISSVEEC